MLRPIEAIMKLFRMHKSPDKKIEYDEYGNITLKDFRPLNYAQDIKDRIADLAGIPFDSIVMIVNDKTGKSYRISDANLHTVEYDLMTGSYATPF